MRRIAVIVGLMIGFSLFVACAQPIGAIYTPDAPVPAAAPASHAVYIPVISTYFIGKTYIPYIAHAILPAEPMPADQAGNVSANSYLSWKFDGPPISGGYQYDLYFDATDATPTTRVAAGLSNPWFETPTFTGATTYSWQVVAINPLDSKRSPGPIWRFTTEALDAPAQLDAMVTIPGGPFWMGCDRNNPYEAECSYNEYHHDEPVRQVTISTFAIDKYEVTNLEYRNCMIAGACAGPRNPAMINDPAYDMSPVLYVSWWNAQDFCRWEGKRLPTEAEWEKAARGTIDTRKYPWGNEEPDCTQVNQKTVNGQSIFDGLQCPAGPVAGIQSVGIHARGASPYGVHDMAGNAFEWVQDKYDVYYYLYAPSDNPQGPPYSRVTKDYGTPEQPAPHDQGRVPVFSIRGGSWRDHPPYMRVVHRHWGHHGDQPNTDIPSYRNDRVGFRCAQSIPQ